MLYNLHQKILWQVSNSIKYKDRGKSGQRETEVLEHILQRSGQICFYCLLCTELISSLPEYLKIQGAGSST